MSAIKGAGNDLMAALDKYDSVDFIDSYFLDANFFSWLERFDRHIDMLPLANGGRVGEHVSICLPSRLLDSHMRFALRAGANPIFESP